MKLARIKNFNGPPLRTRTPNRRGRSSVPSPVELMADKKKTCSEKQVSNQVECFWCRVPPGETLTGFIVPHAYISTKVASIAPPHRGIHHAIIGIWTVKECTLSIALPARYAIQLKINFPDLGRPSKKRYFVALSSGRSNITTPATSTPSARTDINLLVKSTAITRNSRTPAAAQRSFAITGDFPDAGRGRWRSLPAPYALQALLPRLLQQWLPPRRERLLLRAGRA